MKKCPLCTAAIPDDVVIAPGVAFCGACGRNTAEVYRAPSLPPGATPYDETAPQEVATPDPQIGTPQPPAGQIPPAQPGPQFGTQPPPLIGQPPPYGQAPQGGSGPQYGAPPPGYVQPPPQFGAPPYGGQPPYNPQQQGAVYPPPPQYQPGPGMPYPPQSAPPGLNWGAFFVPFAWGPANRVWIGLVGLIGFIPCFGLLSLGFSVYMLIKGNELAWTSGRQWQSVDEFRNAQKQWAIGGGIAFAVMVLLSVLYYSVAMMHRGYSYPRYY